MSDKKTEEAAEEYVYKKHRWFAKECTKVNCKEDFIAGADSLSTTIAQLREENERLKKGMEKIIKEYPHQGYCAWQIAAEALTPKPPKTKG